MCTCCVPVQVILPRRFASTWPTRSRLPCVSGRSPRGRGFGFTRCESQRTGVLWTYEAFPISWGAYDLNQFRQDCSRHHLELPRGFERHINLKKEFARLHGIKPCGMARAMEIAKIPLEGTHHRAWDDARNIAKLAMGILPVSDSQISVPG